MALDHDLNSALQAMPPLDRLAALATASIDLADGDARFSVAGLIGVASALSSQLSRPEQIALARIFAGAAYRLDPDVLPWHLAQ